MSSNLRVPLQSHAVIREPWFVQWILIQTSKRKRWRKGEPVPGRPPHPARRQRSSKTGAMPTCITWCAHTHHTRTVCGGFNSKPYRGRCLPGVSLCQRCQKPSLRDRVSTSSHCYSNAMHQSKLQRFPGDSVPVRHQAGRANVQQHECISHAASSSSESRQANQAQEAAKRAQPGLQPSFHLPCQNPEPWVCVLKRPQRGYTFRKKP